jgi:catechol-2,3-dioxygenase
VGQSIKIRGVNHVALRVRDVESSAGFYKGVLGFTEEVDRPMGIMAFLRAPTSTNHHDLALLQIGPDAVDDSPNSVGLFHLALEVETMDDLVTARHRLATAGCLESEADHGATKSVYAHDPDNNTVELTWVLPRTEWGEWASAAPIKKAVDISHEAHERHSASVATVTSA